jgi:hypothetical protein
MSTTTSSIATASAAVSRAARLRQGLRRRSARVVLGLGVAGAGLAGAAAVGTPAYASYYPVISCSSASGVLSANPGLTPTAQPVAETLSASLGGCTDMLQGAPLAGTGSLFASLSGTASTSAVNESGTFVISWPSYYNPSVGTLTVTGPYNGMYTVSGHITSGAFVGATISTQYFPTASTGAGTAASPRTSQTLVNTLPFKVQRNGW